MKSDISNTNSFAVVQTLETEVQKEFDFPVAEPMTETQATHELTLHQKSKAHRLANERRQMLGRRHFSVT